VDEPLVSLSKGTRIRYGKAGLKREEDVTLDWGKGQKEWDQKGFV